MSKYMFANTLRAKLPAILKSTKAANSISNICQKSKMAKSIDNRLETFRKVCDEIAAESSYKAKASILNEFFEKGSKGTGFKGNLLLWIRMLLPSASNRVYNLQNKQILKLFARIFQTDVVNMHECLEQEGDVSEVLFQYFQQSKKLKPQVESKLYLEDVDEFLLKLAQVTKENDQSELLLQLCTQVTAPDLKTVIRLIKQDLRINARARHVLDAFGPNAYEFYQTSRDLNAVVDKFGTKKAKGTTTLSQNKAKSKPKSVNVMTPISPMLANACKSVEEAFKKSPEGLFSEIKYDGERVQIHKKGNELRFFSRNLKPVMEHKIRRFEEFIPKAFPSGGDMILDSEIILVDKISGALLPFGSLGAHKRKEYQSAEVCLFVFDCILFDGEDITQLAFKKRRQILEQNIEPIKSYVQLSESHFLQTKKELSLMTAKVLKANLEGVVLKSPSGTYQPGKRGWLKVKKDYLFGGKMADTADLVVLGAWYGSGKKGGILSIFLMGCYDPRDRLWKTVTKVHSGLDDETNEDIHQKLMKLFERPNNKALPDWFSCKKPLIPDFIARDPHKMPVWEITGAEFTKSEAHTASGISIRFPRITKLRDDKMSFQANELPYLEKMFEASKNDINVDLLIGDYDIDETSDFQIDSKLNLGSSPSKVDKDIVASKDAVSKVIKRKNEKSSDLLIQKSQKSRKTQSVVEVKRSIETNIFKEKQEKLNSNSDLKLVPERILLFGKFNAFFDDRLCETHKQLIEAFERCGGKTSKNAMVANIIFHVIPTNKVCLKHVRRTYNRNCHHLHIKWLKDSLEAEECLPFAQYALVLVTNSTTSKK